MNSTLEVGESYKVLFTHPKWTKNGTIKGWFPNNSTLSGRVGFVKPDDTPGTDGTRFMVYLHYFVNGQEQWKRIIDIWKPYTGKLKSFSYDLSAFARQNSGQDLAAWVYPKITQFSRISEMVHSSGNNAPKLIYPSDGKVFHHYPRKTKLK